MERVRSILLTFFWSTVLVAVLVVAVFEMGLLESGIAAGEYTQGEVLLTFVVELATIVILPVALRLFKFKKVESDLRQRHEVALQKWGVLRLAMLEAVLYVNLFAYYIYMNTSFGYMGIMAALCLPFVYPSRQKCLYEAFMDVEEDSAEQ